MAVDLARLALTAEADHRTPLVALEATTSSRLKSEEDMETRNSGGKDNGSICIAQHDGQRYSAMKVFRYMSGRLTNMSLSLMQCITIMYSICGQVTPPIKIHPLSVNILPSDKACHIAHSALDITVTPNFSNPSAVFLAK